VLRRFTITLVLGCSLLSGASSIGCSYEEQKITLPRVFLSAFMEKVSRKDLSPEFLQACRAFIVQNIVTAVALIHDRSREELSDELREYIGSLEALTTSIQNEKNIDLLISRFYIIDDLIQVILIRVFLMARLFAFDPTGEQALLKALYNFAYKCATFNPDNQGLLRAYFPFLENQRNDKPLPSPEENTLNPASFVNQTVSFTITRSTEEKEEREASATDTILCQLGMNWLLMLEALTSNDVAEAKGRLNAIIRSMQALTTYVKAIDRADDEIRSIVEQDIPHVIAVLLANFIFGAFKSIDDDANRRFMHELYTLAYHLQDLIGDRGAFAKILGHSGCFVRSPEDFTRSDITPQDFIISFVQMGHGPMISWRY